MTPNDSQQFLNIFNNKRDNTKTAQTEETKKTNPDGNKEKG